jgi:hypothetical protein
MNSSAIRMSAMADEIPQSAPIRMRWLEVLILGSCVVFFLGRAAKAEESEAVSSKVSKDYLRKRLPDGTFKPETYVFGKGDNWSGARVDASIDKIEFLDVLRVIAVPLANQRYLPTTDPKTTNLLIMVYWGTTRAPEHASATRSYDMAQEANQKINTANTMLNDALISKSPAEIRVADGEMNEANGAMVNALEGISAENQRREDIDRRTAALLGYDSWWASTIADTGGTGLGYRKQDMLNELEEDRYFVVLTAIDYQLLVKQKKSKMLWEARFSIREHNNAFDKRLPAMAADASEYFGRDSGGLHHLDLPSGEVILGPVKSLGVVPER